MSRIVALASFWKFCFGVRGLIVLVLVVGAGLGWIVCQAHIHAHAVAAIKEAGGSVRYDWSLTTGGFCREENPGRQQPLPALSPWLASRLYRFTVNQYDKLIEHRTIAENERDELIEGVLVNKMGRNRPHIVAGNKGLRMLSGIIPNGWYIAKEDPVVVSDWSKPEPDLAIVRGQAEDYIDHDVTASDLALVVEIAESSLSTDQQDMAQIDASNAIPLYWIIKLVDRCVEVYSI